MSLLGTRKTRISKSFTSLSDHPLASQRNHCTSISPLPFLKWKIRDCFLLCLFSYRPKCHYILYLFSWYLRNIQQLYWTENWTGRTMHNAFFKTFVMFWFCSLSFPEGLMEYLQSAFNPFLLVDERPFSFGVRNTFSPWSWEFICSFHLKSLAMWSRLFDSAGWHTYVFLNNCCLYSSGSKCHCCQIK